MSDVFLTDLTSPQLENVLMLMANTPPDTQLATKLQNAVVSLRKLSEIDNNFTSELIRELF